MHELNYDPAMMVSIDHIMREIARRLVDRWAEQLAPPLYVSMVGIEE